jgi:hypothetical protein
MPETATTPGLWTPGQPLEVPFEIPTPEAFRERFAQGVWKNWIEPVSLEGSLSALRPVDLPPTAIALLDMDDLVGNLGGSLRALQHPDDESAAEIFTHDYGDGMFFDDGDTAIKWPLIRLAKMHELPGVGMRPVRDIDAITSMTQSWRAAGVYVAFVTSAIEGAELSHVDFLARHFRGACDGIVITSGHYQLVDKGKAATEIVDFTGAKPGTPVVHLDDIGHNTTKVRTALQAHPSGLQVATFQHVFDHASHFGADPGSAHGATPLETFNQANDFLTERFGRTLHIPLAHIIQTA